MPGSGTHINVGGDLRVAAAFGILLQVTMAGCGPRLPPSQAGRSSGGLEREARLRRQLAAQGRQLAELQLRLQLLEREAGHRRVATPALEPSQRSSDLASMDAPPGDQAAGEAERPTSTRARPKLRLRGRSPVATGRRAALAAAARPGVSEAQRAAKPAAATTPGAAELPRVQERLPVVPLPARERRVDKRGPQLQRRYRYALQLLQRQHYRAARRELSLLIRRNPNNDRYYYWRGEAAYAARDYRAALRDFRRVIGQLPASSKLSASLLKAGLCYHHLGEPAESAAVLERMQREFPESAATPLAAMEVP